MAKRVKRAKVLVELHDVSKNSPIHWSGMQTDIGWIHYLLATSPLQTAGLLGPFLLQDPTTIEQANPIELARRYGQIQFGALPIPLLKFRRIGHILYKFLRYYRMYLQPTFRVGRLPDSLHDDIYAQYIQRFDRFEGFKYLKDRIRERFYLTEPPRSLMAFLRTSYKWAKPVEYRFPADAEDIDVFVWSDVYKMRLYPGALHLFRIPDWIPLTHPSYVAGSNLVVARFQAIRHLIGEGVSGGRFKLVAYTKTVAEQTLELFPELEGQVEVVSVVVPSGYRPVDSKLTSDLVSGILRYKQRILVGERMDAIRSKWEKYSRKFVIMALAALEPRKNFVGVAKAVKEFLLRLPPRERDRVFLIIKGSPGWQENHIMHEISRLQREFNIIFVQEILDFEELRALYQASDVFVFPSFTEGFGLPPLEAMGTGTPVIASNIPVLKETHGNAALYVNPYDISDIADKIYTLYKDRDLRQTLIRRGQRRIKRFRPDAVREQWLELIERSLKE